MTGRDFSILVLQVTAWLCAVSAVIVPIYMFAEAIPRDETMRVFAAFGWAINAAVWWAGLLTLAWVSDEVRELHHEIKKAMR